VPRLPLPAPYPRTAGPCRTAAQCLDKQHGVCRWLPPKASGGQTAVVREAPLAAHQAAVNGQRTDWRSLDDDHRRAPDKPGRLGSGAHVGWLVVVGWFSGWSGPASSNAVTWC